MIVALLFTMWSMAPGEALAQEDEGVDAAATAPPTRSSGKKKKREFKDLIVVIQRKPFLRKLRLEIEPNFYFQWNDSVSEQIGAGLNVNFHITEWLFAGFTGVWQDWRFLDEEANGFGSSYEDIIDATDAIPAVSVLNAIIMGEVGVVPLYGKFSLFNTAIIHWDLSVTAGGGVVHSRVNDFVPAGGVGISQRFFLTDWLSLNTELRGTIYSEDLGAGDGSSIYSQWMLGFGVAFWAPFSFDYESE